MRPRLPAAGAAVLITLVSALAHAVPLFKGPPMVFDVGEDPDPGQAPYGDQLTGAAADLNGDGRDDLVVPNYNSPDGYGYGSTISVLMATTAPSLPTLFRSEANYLVAPEFQHSVNVGDWNNDGSLDVQTGKDSALIVLIGDGAGGFPGRVSTPAGFLHKKALMGDVNGDGRLDVVLTRFSAPPSETVFFGTGAGSFTPGPVSATDYHSRLLSDVNRDGKLDLVGVDPTYEIVVGLGNGDGSFQPSLISNVLLGSAVSLEVGDFDGDTFPDLVVGSYGYETTPATVNLLHGLGNGRFSLASVTNIPETDPAFIAARDMDMDGNLDLVVAVNQLSGTTVGKGANTVLVMFGDGTGQFPDLRQLDGGGVPTAIMLGDYDGNALPDIAATNAFDFLLTHPSDHAVTVLRNMGARDFGDGAHRATVYPPEAEAVADMNRDGIPDLVVADNSAYMEIHLGDAFGGYSGVVLQPLTPASSTSRFAIGDINRDGKLDIVAGGANLLYGNGDGTFATGGPIGSPGSTEDESLVDLNRDGRLDLILLQPLSLNVAMGGIATFGPATAYPLPANSRDFHVEDWNRDGKPDVAVATEGGIVRFTGNGDGTLSTAGTIDPSIGFTDVTSGDFNRDGFPDLAARMEADSIVSATLQGVTTYLADGSGGFGAHTVIPTFDLAGYEIASWDVNRDGSPDVVATSLGDLTGIAYPAHATYTTSGAWLGNGTGAFHRDSDYLVGLRPNINRVSFGDLDRDGQTDILGSNDDWLAGVSSVTNVSYVSILRAALPTFTGSFPLHAEYAATPGAVDPVVADFNRDGRLDVAVCGGTSVSVHFGDGAGALGSNGSYVAGTALVTLGGGDLDRDGDQDLVTLGTDGAGAILVNNGQGTFSVSTFSMGSDVTDLALGDLNRDGILDLVVCSTTEGSVLVAMGTGAPGFGTPAVYFPSNGGVHLALGDVNRDGWLDVVTDDPFLGEAAVFRNNGLGGLLTPTYVSTGTGTRDITLGDFDRDGRLDLAAARYQSGGFLSILIGDGAGGFGAPTNYPAGSDPRGITSGDPYGDGILDVLVAAGTGSALIFRGNGDGSLQPFVSWTAAGTPGAIAFGDVDRDGRPDLITANTSANNISVLLDSDHTPTSVAVAGAVIAHPVLDQNRPNPFNPRTEIRFSIPERGSVQLRVFDAAGRVVATLADGTLSAGEHRVVWAGRTDSGAAVASGVYFYRLEAAGLRESKRMVLLK